MKRIQEKISKFFNYLYCLVVYHNNYIILNAWIDLKFDRIKKRNFGDELNYYLFQELTGKHIAGYYNIPHFRKQSDLMFIGSLVEEFTTPESIIWGSGAISGDKPLRNKPAKVCAVRGKLTRQYLLDQGVDCPEVYGDPALLLPLVYLPSVSKKYKIGFLPHVNDLDNPNIKRLVVESGASGHLIKFCNYGDWHKVIDEINECEFIVSSSLHGIIISDAYCIPNVRLTLSDKILGGDFKYNDYYSGVNKVCIDSICVTEHTTVSDLLQYKVKYTPINFDSKQLLAAAPFNIKYEA